MGTSNIPDSFNVMFQWTTFSVPHFIETCYNSDTSSPTQMLTRLLILSCNISNMTPIYVSGLISFKMKSVNASLNQCPAHSRHSINGSHYNYSSSSSSPCPINPLHSLYFGQRELCARVPEVQTPVLHACGFPTKVCWTAACPWIPFTPLGPSEGPYSPWILFLTIPSGSDPSLPDSHTIPLIPLWKALNPSALN